MKKLLKVGKAHQRIIREQKAVSENGGLFGYPISNIEEAIIKPISYNTAKIIIEEYEWLGCMPSIVKYCFGIYYNNVCAGVTVFSPEYSENLGHWDKYGYTGRMLLLSRGVCVHWAHEHSASKLIMESIKQLPKKYDVITATIDHNAGEIGTIYQACNFYYVGSMRESNPKIKYKKKDRFGVEINGKIYGSRSIRAKLGTQKREEILKVYPNAKFIPQHSKDRYFLFRGSKTNKKHLKKSIEHLIKEYPKRL